MQNLKRLLLTKTRNDEYSLKSNSDLRCYSYDGMVRAIKSHALGASNATRTFNLDISKKGKYVPYPVKYMPGDLERVISRTHNFKKLTFYGDVLKNPLANELFQGLHGSVIEKVLLTECKLNLESAKSMSTMMKECLSLEELTINKSDIDPDAFIELAVGISQSTLKYLDVVHVDFKGSTRLLKPLVYPPSKLVAIELMQVDISEIVFVNLCRSIEHNECLKNLFLFKADFLNDKLIAFLAQSLMSRNLVFQLNASLASFCDVGGYCLSRLLSFNILEKLNIRGGNIGNLGVKALAASLIDQDTLQTMSLRILSRAPKPSSCWSCLTVAIKEVKGLRKLRLTDNCIADLKHALDGRLDITQSWRAN